MTTAPPSTDLNAVYHSVLVQDYFMADKIVVDTSQGGSSIGPFVNPGNGRAEALVVLAGAQRQLGHVKRDPASRSHWSIDVIGPDIVANEVCTLANDNENGTIYGFLSDDSNIYSTSLGNDGWTTPHAFGDTMSNLRSGYSRSNNPIVYGVSSDGFLVIASQIAGGQPFTLNKTDLGSLTSGDIALVMTDDATWVVAVNDGGTPKFYTGTITDPASQGYGGLKFDGNVSQIVIGCSNQGITAPLFVLVDNDQNLQACTVSGTTASGFSAITQIPVGSATGHINKTDKTLHLYVNDGTEAGNVSVVHQSANAAGLVSWVPVALGIKSGLTMMASDTNPADGPSLFALDAGNYLHLHEQVATTTGKWRGGAIHQPTNTPIRLSRYRSEITVSAGTAVASGLPVTLTLTNASSPPIDAIFKGNSYTIYAKGAAPNGAADLQLTTDEAGKITLSMLAMNSFAMPQLTAVSNATDGSPYTGNFSLTFSPAEEVLGYITGKGFLNPSSNPQTGFAKFSATSLQNATYTDSSGQVQTVAPQAGQPAGGGQTVGDVAAPALQQSASFALGSTKNNINFTNPLQSSSRLAARQLPPISDDAASLIQGWFGDVWEGIEQGLLLIDEVGVVIEKEVANITTQLGKLYNVAIKDIEQIAHLVAGVFKAIEADIESVLKWLSALFDMTAIWDTKKWLESQIGSIFNGQNGQAAYLTQLITYAQQKTDTWFQDQEAAITQYFQTLIGQYTASGNPTFSSLPHWPDASQGTSGTGALWPNGPSISDFSNNTHHNWLMDQLSSFMPSFSFFSSSSAVDSALNTFISDLTNTFTDAFSTFQSAFSTFEDAVDLSIDGFNTARVVDFLTNLQSLVVGALELIDDLCDDFFALANVVVTALGSALTGDCSIGIFQYLWDACADDAGYSGDAPTPAGVMALIIAFPATLIYKLIYGVNSEPFPPNSTALDASGNPGQNQKVSAILQILYAIPAVLGAFYAADYGTLYGVTTIGLSIAIWITWNGLPQLSEGTWIGIGAAALATMFWAVPAALIIVQGCASLTGLAGDLIVVGTSLYGLVRLVMGIVYDAEGDISSKDMQAAAVLIPIPNLCSFLSWAEDGYAQGVLAVVALIGFVGGGLCELDYAGGLSVATS